MSIREATAHAVFWGPLGAPARYADGAGIERSVRVIRDQLNAELLGGGERVLNGGRVAFRMLKSEVNRIPREGDGLVVGAEIFTIKGAQEFSAVEWVVYVKTET